MGENKARAFDRRRFLKRTAAVSLGTAATASLGTAVSGPWMAPAVAEELPATPPHGAELRGMDLVVKKPTTEGRFGFMFKSQPPHPAPDELLDPLGVLMEEQPTAAPDNEEQKNENDRWNENPNLDLTSGFTFLGQFVDHDITFDTTELSKQLSDPDATTNFRTPRYDLDSIYGLGPNYSPQFYDPSDRDKFLIRSDDYEQITGIVKIGATSSMARGTFSPTRSTTCHATATARPSFPTPGMTRRRSSSSFMWRSRCSTTSLWTSCARTESRVRRCSSPPGAWPAGTTSGS